MLEAAGGKWNRKARAHVFAADASDRMDQIILSGAVEVPKDEFNFFPSTAVVMRRGKEMQTMELSPCPPPQRAPPWTAALMHELRTCWPSPGCAPSRGRTS